MGLISEVVNSDIILLAIITVTVAPFAFIRIFPKEEKLERIGLIVFGQDQLVEYIVERLISSGEAISVICPDQGRIEFFNKLGAPVIAGAHGFENALDEVEAD